jgi:hypothetical protein
VDHLASDVRSLAIGIVLTLVVAAAASATAAACAKKATQGRRLVQEQIRSDGSRRVRPLRDVTQE